MGTGPRISFVEIQSSKDDGRRRDAKLNHSFFGWLGLRPIFAQHTSTEHEAIRNAAAMRRTLVEIGVAEGASAIALRETMAPDGRLFLIDPYHLSRVRFLNTLRRTAQRAVRQCKRGMWFGSSDSATKWRRLGRMRLICCSSTVLMMSRPSGEIGTIGASLFGPVAWLFFMMHVFSKAAGRSQRTAQSVSWTVCSETPDCPVGILSRKQIPSSSLRGRRDRFCCGWRNT